jgi:hypothetical protein
MRLARWIYGLSAVYGVIVLAPFLFLEKAIAAQTAPFNHPEYYYGFLSAALVFQLVFFLIARDPVRLRPIMPATVLEKWGWGVAAWTLWLQHRTQAQLVAFATIDVALGVLFLVAWRMTPKT